MKALAYAAVLLSILIVGVVLTVALWPMWGWLEATFGIESLGHSGPSDWCFVLTTALTFCVACVIHQVCAPKE